MNDANDGQENSNQNSDYNNPEEAGDLNEDEKEE